MTAATMARNRSIKLVTIGVYGLEEDEFFGALVDSGIDTFCDVRFRRGVRGSTYAFVNSKRLQARLAALGIRYLHFPHLAPSKALRDQQSESDKASKTPKRKRTILSEAFVSGYQAECLDGFDSKQFASELGDEAKVVALFCVEGEPAACHRSLLAQRLHEDLGFEVLHLKP